MATAFKQSREKWLDDRITAGRYGISGEVVKLTPDLAQAILDRNPDNRNINKTRVGIYANDIAEGRWALNGEPIIISSEGFCNDGQHRCAAVVESGIPIDTLIVFGVDRETRNTTDQGRSKGPADYLSMEGFKNATVVAGIARIAVCYERTGSVLGLSLTSSQQILDYIQANQNLVESSAAFARSYKTNLHRMIAESGFGFCFNVTRQISEHGAREFLNAVATGENLSASDPALAVRNRLISMGKAGRAAKIEAVFHGWNAFRRGRPLSFIRVNGKLPDLV